MANHSLHFAFTVYSSLHAHWGCHKDASSPFVLFVKAFQKQDTMYCPIYFLSIGSNPMFLMENIIKII